MISLNAFLMVSGETVPPLEAVFIVVIGVLLLEVGHVHSRLQSNVRGRYIELQIGFRGAANLLSLAAARRFPAE
jgi:hypothetical protein